MPQAMNAACKAHVGTKEKAPATLLMLLVLGKQIDFVKLTILIKNYFKLLLLC